MNLFDLFKKQKTRFITKELISLSSLANVPTIDYFKDNNQVLELINLRKKEYLEILIKEKVLTSKDLKANELHNKLNRIHNLIEQNTLGDELFEKVIFNEEDKVKALVKLRKFALYKEQIIELEEEIISRVIALKEILKKTFLNRQKRISIINEINNLTNIFVILMNQKETLRLCLNNYGLKCFDITKEKDKEKEEKLIRERKEELNVYQKQAFGKIVYELNDLNDMAKVEVALEEYVYNYNWKDGSLREKIINFCNYLENHFKYINYPWTETIKFDTTEIFTEILKIENICKIFSEFGKNAVDNEDLKKVYQKKFRFFTIPMAKGNIIEPFINEKTPKIEIETYEEIIYALINDINNNKENGLSSIQMEFKNYTFMVLRLLKKELQTKGKYEAIEILKNKYKLNLLLAFSYPIEISIIKKIYKKIYVKKSDYPEVNFYEPEFCWNEDLPLETINELKLVQNQKKDIGLYLFLKNYYHTNGNYYLPNGLEKVNHLMGIYDGGRISPKQMKEILKFVETIRQKMNGKFVIFPKSLKEVWGDLIGNTVIKKLILNEGLEYFNFNFSPTANVFKMVIPATVKPSMFSYHEQNESKLETISFLDYEKSCFYKNTEYLRSILGPYIKITTCEIDDDGEVEYQRICELTIDNIIISFGNSKFPYQIRLCKEECRISLSEYSTIVEGKYELIKYINYLIIGKITEYEEESKNKDVEFIRSFVKRLHK